MIARLSGLLLARHPPTVLLDVHGVGYEVEVPMSTFYDLPEVGQPLALLTHLVVRDDAHLLYGFLSEAERSTFRQLIKITGVGPRLALAVLSGLSVTDLALAVARQEAGRLQKVPGVGKKTAERLLLELKGKLAPAIAGSTALPVSQQQDVMEALRALGYSDREVAEAVKSLPEDLSVSEGIRQALRQLTR